MANIPGTSGNDTRFGTAGADIINRDGDPLGFPGTRGRDTLFGGAGNDALYGGSGDDHLNGGLGNDVLNVRGRERHRLLYQHRQWWDDLHRCE